MTKKEFIVDQLRSMMKAVQLHDQCLYNIVKKDLTKTDHHVVIEISHRNVEIASIKYNKLKTITSIEIYGRSEGHTWSDDFEVEDYNCEVTTEEKAEIKHAMLALTLQAVEVVMANRNELKLGTIDM